MSDIIVYEEIPEDLIAPENLNTPGDRMENPDVLAAEFDGEHLYRNMPRDKWGWPWDKNYNATYVVKVNFMGKSLYWHKWAVVPLMNVQKQLLEEGWDKKYYWTDLQTWNKRMIAGTNIPSNHAWPTAIDVNPSKNPYRKDNKLVTDIPVRVREIFKRYGFSWGGDYRTVKDAMHWEYLGAPVKDFVERRVLSLKSPMMTGNDVKEMQTLLAYYGYDIDTDGVFGKHSDACVRSFQSSKMLTSDGVVGEQTWRTLLAKQPDRVIKLGMNGADVVWIQKAINKTIKAQLKVDGAYGRDSETAVKLFQTQNYLIVDGIIGAKTWAILRKRTNPK